MSGKKIFIWGFGCTLVNSDLSFRINHHITNIIFSKYTEDGFLEDNHRDDGVNTVDRRF